MALHNAQRDYHFNNMPEEFVNQMTDDFISVNRGEINMPDKDSMKAMFGNYFSSVKFIKWDDVTDPIIRFSEDGTMAYTVVDKMVKLRYDAPEDKSIMDSTRFAWTAIYLKKEGEWKVDNVTSTDRK